MDVDERLNAIRTVGEEIIEEDELQQLLKKKDTFVAYDGFEPSGKMHIAQALLRTLNVNRMIKAGARFKLLIADWHAWANHKLDGDLENIQTTGKYFVEVWKACGMQQEKVEFVWASDLVKQEEYWRMVMQVATGATLNRVLRCTQIMGRSDKESLHASQILYPCMQAADIFYLKADVAQLGMDQRKVNVLARELAGKLGKSKPIVVSHHMLMGLSEPPEGDAVERAIAMKMSKSRPDTAIFVTDTEQEVTKKIKKAYCPQGQTEDNPILEYCKYIIFGYADTFVIERPEKFGGSLTFNSYEALEKAFVEEKLHPLDLKTGVATRINELLEPIRRHFSTDEQAKQLLEKVQSFTK